MIPNTESSRGSALGRDEAKHPSCKYNGNEAACPKSCDKCAIAIKTDGDVALSQDQIDAAIRYYKKALFADPKFAEAWNNLGNAYGMKSEYRNALNAFEKAIAIDPVYGKALYGKAITLRNMGNLEAAMTLANAILEIYDAAEVRRFKKDLVEAGIEDTQYLIENKKAITVLYSRWYTDLFKLIEKHMDLQKMKPESAESLVSHILTVLADEQERELITYAPTFLCVMRKQMPEITNELDAIIAEHFPKYYNGVYLLETTDTEEDLPAFVKRYVDETRKTNETQGQGGVYFGHGTRTLATIRSIFCLNEVKWDVDLMDSVISVAMDTLLISKEGIQIKLDAVSLLVCIVLKFPDHYARNQAAFDVLFEKKKEIQITDFSLFSSNVDNISLEIGLCFLEVATGRDAYLEILDLLPCIQNDIPTTISVASMIKGYLSASETATLPRPLGAIVLQNVLQWLRSEHLDVRYIATKILLQLSRESENESIVNRQIINLVDTESIYIKNLIINHIFTMKGVWETTRNYVVSKCENDECFIVRMVCGEQKKQHDPS